MMSASLSHFLKQYTPTPEAEAVVSVERAALALRHGDPVLLEDGAARYVVYATEALSQATWDAVREIASIPQLWLTANRLAYLRKDHTNRAAYIAASTIEYQQLQQLAGTFGANIAASSQTDAHAWHPGEEALRVALDHLAHVTELLPAWVVIPVTEAIDSITLPRCSAAQLSWYRQYVEVEVVPVVEAPLHLRVTGAASMTAFRAAHSSGKEHYAIHVPGKGGAAADAAPLVRVHSSCYTGDLLGSLTCDCGEQLQAALAQMAADPAGGLLVYLQQEGRGIGLINKLRCYAEQAKGMDTVEANEALGFADDAREFAVATAILKKCNATRLRLLSNNPRKAEALEKQGIEVVALVAHVVESAHHPLTQQYMQIKKQHFGHRLP